MAQRKPYNPNTAYGRKKLREDHQRWKESLPPEERRKLDQQNSTIGCVILVIIIIIVLIIGFATGNGDGALKWLSR